MFTAGKLLIVLALAAMVHAEFIDDIDDSPVYDGKYRGIKDCSLDTKKGTKCLLTVDKLSPTQFCVGETEVMCKVEQYQGFSKKKLREYLDERIVPVSIGPGGKFHLTDRHHMSSALLLSGLSDTPIVAEIKRNWREKSQKKFWQAILEESGAYLIDARGVGPLSPLFLPPLLENLSNDPYRSLAWFVRREGGFSKEEAFDFMEFEWAAFFREKMPFAFTPQEDPTTTLPGEEALDGARWEWCQVEPFTPKCFPDLDKAVLKALPKALELALSDEAKDLPGWGKGKKDPIPCDLYLNELLSEE